MVYAALFAGVFIGYAAGVLFLPAGGEGGLLQGRYVAAVAGGLIGWWSALMAGGELVAWAEPVIEVQGEQDFERVLAQSSEAPVLVDFYATWCPPCRRSAPHMNELALDGHRVAVVDIERNLSLVSRYEVDALPTLVVLRHGKVVARTMGYLTAEELRRLLASVK